MPTPKKLHRMLAALAFGLLAALPSSAELVYNEVYNYYIHLPHGWELMDAARADHVSFSDVSGEIAVQVVSYPGERFGSASEIAGFISDGLSAEVEPAPFSYAGRDAAIADVSFQAGSTAVRGYQIYINGAETDFLILSSAPVARYEAAHDFLLSTLDSFAPGAESRSLPGPVSHFFDQPGVNIGDEPQRIEIPAGRLVPDAQGTIPMTVDEADLDAAQVTIDREARVLSVYEAARADRETFSEAWRRYYQAVYRDSFARLLPLTRDLRARFEEAMASGAMTREEIPQRLLYWFQDFTYARPGGISDLLAPEAAVFTQSGDCDSLALAYAIVLHQLGFDAILMVSPEFGHAMAGVDLSPEVVDGRPEVSGGAARFDYAGRRWLVAELTAQVDLGNIEARMADASKWIGIPFNPEP
jgi:hypothetical protein